jgi:cytochrome c oxidase assembly protein subunit 15
VAIALVTSPSWNMAPPGGWRDDHTLRVVATTTTVVIYSQILLGATMRHADAGLAIPDFPLVFGGIVPPYWTPQIAIHYAHRVGALLATAAIFATAGHVWLHHPDRKELRRPATLLAVLVLVQISLGGLIVLTKKDVAINTAHVVSGALVLATSLVLTLRSHRARFADAAESPARVSAGMSPAGVRA